MTTAPDDELVPVSVRLGEVVPPEDPEDWTRPLTWVVALGMLAGPVAAAAWFLLAAPAAADRALPGTFLVAALVSGGAAATGSTQVGRARAWTATLGASLFAALVIVVVGVFAAGDRPVATASPTMVHAVTAGLAGMAGAVVASGVSALMANVRSRVGRFAPALAVGVPAALGGVAVLMR